MRFFSHRWVTLPSGTTKNLRQVQEFFQEPIGVNRLANVVAHSRIKASLANFGKKVGGCGQETACYVEDLAEGGSRSAKPVRRPVPNKRLLSYLPPGVQ